MVVEANNGNITNIDSQHHDQYIEMLCSLFPFVQYIYIGVD